MELLLFRNATVTFLNPLRDPDQITTRPNPKNSSKFIDNFLSYCANRQTYKGKNINYLAEATGQIASITIIIRANDVIVGADIAITTSRVWVCMLAR